MSPPKPMLACKDWELSDIVFPVIVQPKLDGVRALVKDGVVYARSGDPIKNLRVQRDFGSYEGCDGELVAKGSFFDHDCCRKTTSITNSPSKDEPCDFVVYDDWSHGGIYSDRFDHIRYHFRDLVKNLIFIQCEMAENISDIMIFDKMFLTTGYEGSILRDPMGYYKEGRSSKKDRKLWALKGFLDTEAEVVGSTEQMHNNNEAEKNAHGGTKRASKKEFMIPAGMLGSLICKAPEWEPTFEIGTGFDHALRKELWDNKETLVGKLVRFKYFPTGSKERPRFPTFITFRDKSDL